MSFPIDVSPNEIAYLHQKMTMLEFSSFFCLFSIYSISLRASIQTGTHGRRCIIHMLVFAYREFQSVIGQKLFDMTRSLDRISWNNEHVFKFSLYSFSRKIMQKLHDNCLKGNDDGLILL